MTIAIVDVGHSNNRTMNPDRIHLELVFSLMRPLASVQVWLAVEQSIRCSSRFVAIMRLLCCSDDFLKHFSIFLRRLMCRRYLNIRRHHPECFHHDHFEGHDEELLLQIDLTNFWQALKLEPVMLSQSLDWLYLRQHQSVG